MTRLNSGMGNVNGTLRLGRRSTVSGPSLAWSPTMKTPRPSAAPVLWQSTQATLYSCSGSRRSESAKNSSRLPKRMLVTSTRLERIGINWISAHVMRPVSPSPPIVAANSSAWLFRAHSSCEPSLRARPRRRTCRPNVPRTWWFLPWTSLAMAPPSVAYLVPGVTGSIQPRGIATSSSCSSVAPGSARRMPAFQSAAIRRSSGRVCITWPDAARQLSP
ncbi:hypothetical protein ACEQUB_00064 [Ralstonia syzygii]